MAELALIGGGHMAEAILKGSLASGFLRPAEMIVAEPVESRRNHLARQYGVRTVGGNREAAGEASRVLLAVKPQQLEEAVSNFPAGAWQDKLVISILAGVPTARLARVLGAGVHLARVMPNTPAMVLAGASAVYFGGSTVAEDRSWTLRLFSAVGLAVPVDKESLLDAVTGLSGSGPAFGYVMIEAMADGGVAAGLGRAEAQRLAAQTLLGAAKMVLESGEHPGVLKDRVASPAGTTIEGLRRMEESGVRAALSGAVLAAARRSKELGQD